MGQKVKRAGHIRGINKPRQLGGGRAMLNRSDYQRYHRHLEQKLRDAAATILHVFGLIPDVELFPSSTLYPE